MADIEWALVPSFVVDFSCIFFSQLLAHNSLQLQWEYVKIFDAKTRSTVSYTALLYDFGQII